MRSYSLFFDVSCRQASKTYWIIMLNLNCDRVTTKNTAPLLQDILFQRHSFIAATRILSYFTHLNFLFNSANCWRCPMTYTWHYEGSGGWTTIQSRQFENISLLGISNLSSKDSQANVFPSPNPPANWVCEKMLYYNIFNLFLEYNIIITNSHYGTTFNMVIYRFWKYNVTNYSC